MTWFKRIALFFILNAVIITTLSIVLSLFGVQSYLTPYGISYKDLMLFCLIWGMGGAFISLLLSKQMAKWMMGVKIISPNTQNAEEKWLLESVAIIAKQARLPKAPQVGIFPSESLNAFATGPSRSNSLIAVSKGLLNSMKKEEVLAVIGHEMAHIANGDMVTMTLLQGIINAFVMFFARVLAYAVSSAVSGRSRNSSRNNFSPMLYIVLTIVFEIAFMFLGFMLIALVSRWREFRADKGGAEFAGKMPMIHALQALEKAHAPKKALNKQTGFEAMQIRSESKLLRLFATHPPLKVRIERLEAIEMSSEMQQA